MENTEVEVLELPIPLHDRILIKKLNEEEQKTASGLYLGTNVNPELAKGYVLAVGQGRIFNGEVVPLFVKEGDIVRFNERGGSEFTENGTKYLAVKEADITAIIGRKKQKKTHRITAPVSL